MDGRDRIEKWLDRVESCLETEAEQVGLLEHSSMIGAGREFVVRRVLSSILPRIVHVASGKVIDRRGNVSRQVDIILYDSRFPVFEVDRGLGLYPIEGVLGAIEVKSTLDKKQLLEALDNVRSIIDLTVGIAPQTRWCERVDYLKSELNDEREACRRATMEFMPACYLFAFNTRLRMRALSNGVEDWFKKFGNPAVGRGDCPVLPRIIIGGKTIGLLDDGDIRVDPGNDIWPKYREQYGNDVRHLMSFWDTKRRFGWLACSLLKCIMRRLGPEHAALGVQYDITGYLPLASYSADIAGKRAWHSPWVPKAERG